MPDWSKYNRSPEAEAKIARATERARAMRNTPPKRSTRREFARITPDMFPFMVGLGGPAILLLEMLVMLSGRRKAKAADGWTPIPGDMLRLIALEGGGHRSRVIRRLISSGLLETRSPGPGRALEYRLLLPATPATTH